MTEQEFLSKVQELLPELNELIMKKAQRAIDSGALDLASYENNYLAPKIFMSAMGNEIAWQYRPLEKHNIKASKNLSLFL